MGNFAFVMFGLTCAVVGFLGGLTVEDREVHATTIKVLEDWASSGSTLPQHTYLIASDDCLNDSGCEMQLCDGSPDPGFDVGDWVKVKYAEKPNGRGGMCTDFSDLSRTAWAAIPRKAKGR